MGNPKPNSFKDQRNPTFKEDEDPNSLMNLFGGIMDAIAGDNKPNEATFQQQQQPAIYSDVNRKSAEFGEQNDPKTVNLRNQALNSIDHRTSADTKASSSQSAMRNSNAANGNSVGLSPQEAISLFYHQLTEFERIEIDIGQFERIYTIG